MPTECLTCCISVLAELQKKWYRTTLRKKLSWDAPGNPRFTSSGYRVLGWPTGVPYTQMSKLTPSDLVKVFNALPHISYTENDGIS